MSFVCDMIAGTVERKKPAIGNNTNSRGKRNRFIFDTFSVLGRFRKSIYIIISDARRHEVKIIPASFGSSYPSVVREKLGLIKGMIFAATVIINQLTGQRKWSINTCKSIRVFRMKGTPGTVNHH